MKLYGTIRHGKTKTEKSVEALEDSEDEIGVFRIQRSSYRRIKILDDSESDESEHRSIHTRVMEIEDSGDENGTPLKLHTNWLMISLLNFKPGLNRPTEVVLISKPANNME